MLLITLIDRVFLVYMLMLFARILCSWVPELREYKVMQFVAYYTDPYLNLFRRIIPALGMIDISPIFAFLSLGLIEAVVKWVVSGLFL